MKCFMFAVITSLVQGTQDGRSLVGASDNGFQGNSFSIISIKNVHSNIRIILYVTVFETLMVWTCEKAVINFETFFE